MKQTKKHRLKILPWCLLALLLLAAVLCAPALLHKTLPKVYGESYYAALPDKVALLEQTEGPKTVVIGGSGVAFTIDPLLLSEKTGQPCVNFGLYAAFGTGYMLELAEPYIGEGDTVIVCPELDEQTCSLYFGADAALQASEGDLSLLLSARLADWPNILTGFPGYLRQKMNFLRSGEYPSASGVYARASFDGQGRLSYPREENLMEGGYQKGSEPTVDPAVYTDDFLDYLNRFARKCGRRGATVLYGLPFMNALSVSDTEAGQAALLEKLRAELCFPLLSGFENRILDPGYFYDSNYHTNCAGTEAATLLLAQDLCRYRGTLIEVSLPAPLDYDGGGNGETLTTADGNYLYRLTDAGAALVGIPGLLEETGTLTLPATLEGYPLTAVDEKAFAGAKASVLILPESVAKLGGHLFEGCEALRELHLLRTESLPTVGDDLLEGFGGKLQIYVASALYGDYATDYFWLYYAGNLVQE